MVLHNFIFNDIQLTMKKYFLYIKIAIYIIVPLVLLLLPVDFFDNGETICLSQRIFGIECYACGLTRGIMHLIHLDFPGAYYYNMLSFIAFPVLAYLWATGFLKDRRRLQALSIPS